MAHTAGQLAEATGFESHGSHDPKDSRTLHELAHASGTADLSHDNPWFTITVATAPAKASPEWVDGYFSIDEFSWACTMERPPQKAEPRSHRRATRHPLIR